MGQYGSVIADLKPQANDVKLMANDVVSITFYYGSYLQLAAYNNEHLGPTVVCSRQLI